MNIGHQLQVAEAAGLPGAVAVDGETREVVCGFGPISTRAKKTRSFVRLLRLLQT